MIKKLIFCLCCLLFNFYFAPFTAQAQDQFKVDSLVTYTVSENGKTLVTHDIQIENLVSASYASTYLLTLENITAENVRVSDIHEKVLQNDIAKKDNKLLITVKFHDPAVGKGAKSHIILSYENPNFAIKTGEIWEISIPKLSDNDNYENYIINLVVPDSFGEEAYLSPIASSSSRENGTKKYTFNKEIISQNGVTAGFGQFQVFTFNLSYHLQNPLAVNSETEIALPPDTAFQKVFYTQLDPKPTKVRIDSDGNYIAVYKLTPKQRIDVVAEGSVQIFSGFRPFVEPSQDSLSDSLKPTAFWQTEDPRIKELAMELKTPEKIYDYVTEYLKYNFDRVQPNVVRFGSTKAFENPTSAICMEFTDLFIAIARASGIPAREVNGYAYTENRQLQPLSLVADVLHSWPEYYDSEKKVWIPVDPTWGSTSGTDYFNKLDLRHFTFVIHGKSDKEPYPPGSYKLGPNPQKDVFVSFGKLPMNRNTTPKISLKTIRNIPFFDMVYGYKVYNPGPSTMYTFYPTVYFGNKMNSRLLVEMLPPFASFESQFVIPYSLLGRTMPENVKVTVAETQINFNVNKTQVIVNSLVVLFAAFILLILVVLAKFRKNNFQKIIGKITGIYGSVIRKINQNTRRLFPKR